MKRIRCSYCGKFIGYAEFQRNEIKTEFTMDTQYSVEHIEHIHKKCLKG